MIYFLYSLLLLSTWSNTDLAQTPENKSAFAPVILIDSIAPTSCYNAADGAIFITVKQAELPLSYLWSNGATTEDLIDVPSGFYSCTVTDANGEQSSADDIFIEAPQAITIHTDSIAVPDCQGNEGYIAISADGGTPSYAYIWNTGDTEPVLENLDEGTYSVTVTDANGCSAVLEILLHTDIPTAATADAVINCANPIITLSAEGSSVGDDIAYSWTTTSGHIIGNPDSFLIYAAAAGFYDLLVTNTLNGCTAGAQALVTVDLEPPVIDLGDDISVACTNTVDTLWSNGPAGSEFSYTWMALNGGHLTSNAELPYAVFDHTGTFVLTVINTNNGCQAIDTIVVSGLNPPPSATVAGDTLSCLQDSITLSAAYDTLNTIWNWQGPGGFSSVLDSPLVGNPGTYWFTLTDTLTGCFIQKPAVVVADTMPAVIWYNFGGTLSCASPEVQIGVETDSMIATGYYWYGPNGFESAEQSPLVSEAGTYIVFATNLSNGCATSDTLEVEGDFTPPYADAGEDQTITCTALQVALDGSASSAGSNIAYVWTTPDGNLVSGDSTATPVVDAAGTYTLTVIDDANGCSASDEVVVTLETTQPTVTADVSDTLSCQLTEVTLSGSVTPDTDVEYAWSGPDNFSSNELTLLVSEPGLYTLTATHVASGCSAEVSVEVFSTAPV
ncbi:MAG TPA: PKD domain-containing protein, partial [Saprospiraceae bacterium]|nr:PKD domain-containing protein [Saprospiraceae bacterium]